MRSFWHNTTQYWIWIWTNIVNTVKPMTRDHPTRPQNCRAMLMLKVSHWRLVSHQKFHCILQCSNIIVRQCIPFIKEALLWTVYYLCLWGRGWWRKSKKYKKYDPHYVLKKVRPPISSVPPSINNVQFLI